MHATPTPTPAHAPAPTPTPAPATRDVWADAVRAGSLLVVVLGHWLLAVVGRDAHGALDVDTILVAAPWTHWLTLGLQVMGAFFLVGGMVSVGSWRRARAEAGARQAYAPWLRSRLARLVVPTIPLIGLWVALPPVLRAVGLAPDLAAAAALNAVAPLWFLAVYVLVQAALPLVELVVARVGWVRTTAVLLGLSALVDLAARGHDVVWAGYGGYVAVWTIPVALGIALADGQLSRRAAVRLAAGGAAALAVLIGWLGYPVLMVGTLPDGGSNQNPPSLALAALICLHVGLLVLTRARLTRVLERPAARRLTAVAAAWSMPLFLWHMSAMVLAVGASIAVPAATAGLLGVDPLSPLWWVVRPLWWVALVIWTTPLLALSAWADRRTRLGAADPGRAPVLVAAALAVAALVVGTPLVDRAAVAVGALLALVASASLLGVRPARGRRP